MSRRADSGAQKFPISPIGYLRWGLGGTMGEGMSAGIPFSHFRACRNSEDQVAIDRLFANNISVVLAFISYKIRISPNQITMMSGFMGIVSLALSILLPIDRFITSIVLIFAASQLSYFLDCTDGLLARSTNNTSTFGEFFDHTLDAFSFFIIFGGFFSYLYRHYESIGDSLIAHLCLIFGFFIIFTHTIRFVAWGNFLFIFGSNLETSKTKENIVIVILKNAMDHQVSLFGMLLFLLHPIAAFALYFLQGVILLAVYFRYFYRAYHSAKN